MTAYGAPITTSDTYYGEREHRWLARTLLGQKMVGEDPNPPCPLQPPQPGRETPASAPASARTRQASTLRVRSCRFMMG